MSPWPESIPPSSAEPAHQPAGPELATCFYAGTVRHRRRRPVEHAFAYRTFFVYLDLAEAPRLLGRRGLWSLRRPAAARFDRGEHWGDPQVALDEAIRRLVDQRCDFRPAGPIRLLTNFRYFGFRMNPVSCYFCFDGAGKRLEAVVAEVNNTPWDEQHAYVLDVRGQATNNRLAVRHAKEFHVSPFLPLDMEYRWRMTPPGRRLAIRIENHDAAGLAFDAGAALRRVPFTAANRWLMLLAYPLLTLKIFAAIYWQAWRLWRRGAPFHPHPARPPRAGAGLRPSPSPLNPSH